MSSYASGTQSARGPAAGGSEFYGSHAEQPSPSLRLPMLPRTARILPQPPPEFASVYSRRSRNRYDSGVGASPRLQPAPPGSGALGDTQAIASVRWKSQKTAQLAAESALSSVRFASGAASVGTLGSVGETAAGGWKTRRKKNVHNFPMWETQKFREEHALREGRAIQDDRFWSNVKEQRKSKRAPVLAGPDGELPKWNKQVKPWVQQRNREKKTYTDKRLRRARKEHREIEKQQDELKDKLYKKGKKMLKDIDFLVERKIESMDTFDVDLKSAHTDAHHFREAKDKLLSDKQAGISREKCYEIEVVHRAMLKDLFLSMDDDESGLLEEPEVKMLAIALGQKLTQNEVVAGAYRTALLPAIHYPTLTDVDIDVDIDSNEGDGRGR